MYKPWMQLMCFVYLPAGKILLCFITVQFLIVIVDLADVPFFSIFLRSVELKVNGLDNRNYTLSIKNLLEEIYVDKSHWKVKTGIMCYLPIKKE
jgi:hypothetical protein